MPVTLSPQESRAKVPSSPPHKPSALLLRQMHLAAGDKARMMSLLDQMLRATRRRGSSERSSD